MIIYDSKFTDWLQHTLIGMSSDKRYRHSLLKEDLAQRDKIIEDLKQYIQAAHEDTQRHLRELAGYPLNPFEEGVTQKNPAEGYPGSYHIVILQGYFGEIFAAIIAQFFSRLK